MARGEILLCGLHKRKEREKEREREKGERKERDLLNLVLTEWVTFPKKSLFTPLLKRARGSLGGCSSYIVTQSDSANSGWSCCETENSDDGEGGKRRGTGVYFPDLSGLSKFDCTWHLILYTNKGWTKPLLGNIRRSLLLLLPPPRLPPMIDDRGPQCPRLSYYHHTFSSGGKTGCVATRPIRTISFFLHVRTPLSHTSHMSILYVYIGINVAYDNTGNKW